MQARALRVLLIPVIAALAAVGGLHEVSTAQETEAVIPPEISDFIANSTPTWADREHLSAALADAAGNWRELADALNTYRTVMGVPEEAGLAPELENGYNNLVWLIVNASHLDRLELTAAVLLESVFQAGHSAEHFGYDTGSEFYRRYVLNYRLDDEPVTLWRERLKQRYLRVDLGAAYGRRLATVDEVVAQAAHGFVVHERGYYGNLGAPLAIDSARAGTSRELALLCAAALRSQGYATRFVSENRSGESWVEVYDADSQAYEPAAWLPVYPTAPERNGDTAYATELCGGRICVVAAGDAFGREQVTARYSKVCGVIPRFTELGAEVPDFEHFTICAWSEGYYKPLDDLGYPLGDMDYPAGGEEGEPAVYFVGAPGEYRLECGVRYPGAVVDVQTRDFTAVPGEVIELDFNLDAPEKLPAAALVERQVDWEWARAPETAEYLLLIVFDEGEPSVRARKLLERYSDDPRLEYQGVPYGTTNAEFAAWIRDDLKVKDTDQLPVVILLNSTSETLLYRTGFDLAIVDWVEQALAREGD